MIRRWICRLTWIRKAMAGVAVLLAVGLACAGMAGAEPVRAAFLTDGSAWMKDFGNALAKALEGREILLETVAPVTPLAESQAEKIAELGKGDIAVLLVWPANPLEPGATFRGVSVNKPLLLLGPDAPESGRKVVVCPDPQAIGRIFAGLVRQCVPDGLLVGLLARKTGDAFAEAVRKALAEELKAGDISIRLVKEDNGDPGAARENARQLLEKHPELAGLVGIEPYHLSAMAAAAADAKRAGYVGLVGTGWPETLGESMEKGFVNGVAYPDVEALAGLLAPMIRAAAGNDGGYAWPESGRTVMPLATRFTPKPYGITELLHGLPGDWHIKAPASQTEPSAGKFD